MGNFNRGGNSFSDNNRGDNRNRFSGGGRDSRGSNFRREDRGPVTMTRAVCDKCKKPCEVPFRPTTGKLVYCNDCFRNQGSPSQDRAPRRDFNDKPQTPKFNFPNNESEMIKKSLELLNSKLDKLCYLLENFTQAKTSDSKKTEIVKSMTVSLPKKENKEVKKEIKKKTIKK